MIPHPNPNPKPKTHVLPTYLHKKNTATIRVPEILQDDINPPPAERLLHFGVSRSDTHTPPAPDLRKKQDTRQEQSKSKTIEQS